MMHRCFWGPLAGVALASLASCTRHAAAPAAAVPDESAWRARLTKDRADKDREFATSATSPIAGVDRLTIEAAGYLALDGQTLRFDAEASPAARIHWQPVEHHWTWQVVGDAPVKATDYEGKRTLAPGELTEATLFTLSDRISATAQTASGVFVITEFDARRAEHVAFKQLSYFPLDSRFVVPAQLERVPNPPQVTLATSRGTTKDYVRYATVRFEIDGQPYALTAFRPAGSKDRELFVPFRDATSGKESYGAARFLDLDEPEAGGTTLVIDFNEAYNPLCNYSPAWNCPLPPPENTLKLAVRAGERAYAH